MQKCQKIDNILQQGCYVGCQQGYLAQRYLWREVSKRDSKRGKFSFKTGHFNPNSSSILQLSDLSWYPFWSQLRWGCVIEVKTAVVETGLQMGGSSVDTSHFHPHYIEVAWLMHISKVCTSWNGIPNGNPNGRFLIKRQVTTTLLRFASRLDPC